MRFDLPTFALTLSMMIAAPDADAQDILHATDGQTLYAIDTLSFNLTQIGPMPLLTGSGGAVLGTVLPAGLPTPFSFTMQLFVADSGGAASFANSRGLQVNVDS